MIKINSITYLTIEEAAEKVGLKVSTLYCMHKKWGWQSKYNGNRLFFEETQIDEWLSSRLTDEHTAVANREKEAQDG